jgi:hypothetical protein
MNQFAIIFHILKHGKPMLEYETHMELFDFLNLEEIFKMHWIDSTSWTMAQHMHNMVLEANIFTIMVVWYILFDLL